MLYLFVFFYGICHGGRIASQVGILGEFFGMQSLGELIGITTALNGIVASFAPYMAGFVFDITGSYFTAFMILTILLLIGSIITVVIKNPERK